MCRLGGGICRWHMNHHRISAIQTMCDVGVGALRCLYLEPMNERNSKPKQRYFPINNYYKMLHIECPENFRIIQFTNG